MNNYAPKTVVDEGTDAYGTNKQIIFHGHDMVIKRTYDAEPILEQCHAERIATADQRWGEMRKVGTIPMAEYAKFMQIKDQNERRKVVKLFLQQNPMFCSFDKYLKK